MRSHLAAIFAVLLLAPSAAHSVSLPFTIPAPAKGFPHVLAAGDSGALIAVWSTDEIYEGYGPLTVDTVVSGPGVQRRRWRTTDALLADHARDSKANLDLLAAHPTGKGDDRRASIGAQRFTPYRARQDGSVRRVWSGGLGRNGLVARRGSEVAVAWVDHRGKGPVLRLVTSRDGRSFSHARAVRGVLPAFLRTADPSFINDLDMTLDAEGDPVIALTAWRRPSASLVIAELDRTARARHRQTTSNVDGVVHAKTTRRGRVAVMVDDTGIEGDRGECVTDRLGRRLFATVRERRVARFAPVTRLDAHPLECSGGESALVTDAGSERVAVSWTSSPQGRPSSVKTVFSVPGQGFGAPLPIDEGAILRAAVFGQAVYTVFSIQQTTEDPYAGPLVMQSVSASGISAPSLVDPTGASAVLATTDPTDHILLGRRHFRDNSLHLTGYGGQ